MAHIKYIERYRLGTVLRYLRQLGAPVTVSPHRVLRYAAGRVARVAWAGGIDSEGVGPVPVPEHVSIVKSDPEQW